jgi:pyrroline-5-carboxylate reductase
VAEESQLHAITAISGSGPGYVFAFMEALIDAAVASGLPEHLATTLVTQTVRGAALLAEQSAEDAKTLRAQVTSKGGTTEAALAVFDEHRFAAMVHQAVAAAAKQSAYLANIHTGLDGVNNQKS